MLETGNLPFFSYYLKTSLSGTSDMKPARVSPRAWGHTLVITTLHFGTLLQATESTRMLMTNMIFPVCHDDVRAVDDQISFGVKSISTKVIPPAMRRE